MARKILFTFIFLLGQLYVKLVAQTTGNLVGKVIDKGTGEPIIGATIIVEGAGIGSATDLDGKYIIKSLIADKEYKIICSFIGYKKVTVNNVKITIGKNEVLDFVIEESKAELTEVVIENKIKKGTSDLLQLELKAATTVGSGVSAEQIRRTPDKTVADALKRVSGASIQDNKYAIVRGLGDRYNMGYLNGVPLPSTESDRKAFSLDLIPSTVIENVIITKTATADMPGDFAGGFVQINTRDIPYDRTISAQAGIGTHSITTGKDFRTGKQSSTDWMGYDNSLRSLPDGVLPYDSTRLLGGRGADARILVGQARLFQNKFGTTTQSARPNYSFQASFADRYKILGNEFGVVAAYSYSNNLRFTPSKYLFVSAANPLDSNKYRDFDSVSFNNYRISVLNSGLLNFSYKVGAKSKFSFKNLWTQTSDNQNIIRKRKLVSNDGQDEIYGTDYFYQFQQNSMMSSQFRGEHSISKANINVNYTLGYTGIKREVPDFKKLYYDSTTQKPAGDTLNWSYLPTQARIYPFNYTNSFNPNGTGRFYSTLDENAKNATLNVSAPLKTNIGDFVFKAGVFYQSRARDFKARNFLIATASNNNPFKTFAISKLGPDEIFNPENFSDSTILQKETTQLSDKYKASSLWTAGYLMTENNLFDNKLRLIYGVRQEKFTQKLSSATLGKKIEVDKTVTDLLPSANIIYAPTDKWVVRLAYSKTLSRPEFREFAPLAFYEVNYNTIVVGNDSLKRTLVKNYDAKLEYYFGSGSMLAINPFMKEFTSPVEYFISQTSGGSNLSYQNTKAATNRGIEFEGRVNFSFIDSLVGTNWASGFTVFGNYAFINSKVDLEITKGQSTILKDRPLLGQSNYLINLGLQYSHEETQTDVLLSYNKIGRRIVFTSNVYQGLIWENPRDVIDLSLTKTWFKKLQTRLIIGDLLAQELTWYTDRNINGKLDSNDIRSFVYKNGRTISFSASYQF